jgi:hypothetical protein
MSIPDHARANFETLLHAAADGNRALMECADASTAEPRYVICAVSHDGGDYVFTPFGHLADGDRAAVIVKHARWLADQHHLLRALDELRGRDLVCFCAPLACHGDLLKRLANASRDERIAWWRAVKTAV